MPGLRIWQGCEHARVTQGAGSHNIPEQALICLKNVQNCLNMREYAENEYDWTYAGIYLKKRVFNMPEFCMRLMQYIA